MLPRDKKQLQCKYNQREHGEAPVEIKLLRNIFCLKVTILGTVFAIVWSALCECQVL